MNKINHYSVCIGALLVSSALVSTGALAQEGITDSGTNEGARYGDIVVTAAKRSENLMDVPVAISAYNSDTLQAIGVSDIKGIEMANPSITLPMGGSYAQLYIRGVGSRLLQNGLEPSVASYVDNRYLARQSGVVLDFVDIERVEILKGPQGVLFGRNASAGAVRVITKDVSDDFEGYLEGGYGNYDAVTLAGVINIPIGNTFGIRLAGKKSMRDGFADNLVTDGPDKLDDKDYGAFRAKAKWEPTDNLTIKGTFSWWEQHDNTGNDVNVVGIQELQTGIAAGGITGQNRSETATMLIGTTDKREISGDLEVKLNLGGVDLTSISTYTDYDTVLNSEGGGSSVEEVDAYIPEKTNNYSQEFQISSNNDSRLEWIVGAYFFRDNTRTSTILNPRTTYIDLGYQKVISKSYAAFGQAKFSFSDALALTVGARYTKDKKNVALRDNTWTPDKLAQYGVPTTVGVAASTAPVDYSHSWKKFTPTVTLEYSFADMMAYAKFARGYKSGGTDYPARGSFLKPEVIDMYEIGLKGNMFDRAVRMTLSGYYYDYKDLQVTRAGGAGDTAGLLFTDNAANAELYGVDLDLTWFATDRLTFSGSIAWQHSKYKDYTESSGKVYKAILDDTYGTANPTPGMTDVPFDASGEQLLRAPSFSAFASVNYDFLLPNATVPLNISYAYKGAYNFDFIIDPNSGDLRQKPYHLVNARLGYRPDSGNWSANIWARNLFNELYYDDVVAAGSGIRASYGAPRTYGVDFRVNF